MTAEPSTPSGDPAALAASGPRTAGREAQYAELIGDIVTGARLHYGGGASDPDLALLEGDQRYAQGLAKLAELGDLDATRQLADVISLVAQASAAGDAELACAVWEAGAVAVGWGTDERLEAAKRAVRAGAAGAVSELASAAGVRLTAAGPGSGTDSPD